MAQALQAPFSQFIDSNGNPLAGGKIYTYAAGTTTPKNSYSDAAGTIANTNPVILDSSGRADIWLLGSYKIIVKDSADVLIHTTDNVIGSSNIGDMSSSIYDIAAIQEQLVGINAVQTISNKTLSSNTIATTQATGDNSTKPATTAYTMATLASNSYTLGGFVNKLRNNTLEIWQRGTSGTVTAPANSYTADGWQVQFVGANGTWSQVANTGNNSPKYAMTITGNTSVTSTVIYRKVESYDAAVMQGNQVTYQITLVNNSGATLTPIVKLYYANASDNFTAITLINQYNSQSIANATQGTYCYTFAATPNAYNGLMIVVDFGAALNANTKSVTIVSDDFRVTNFASGASTIYPTVEHIPASIESTRCQRYYWSATLWFNQNVTVTYTLPVLMRATPTISGAATGLAGYVTNTNTASVYCGVISAASQNSSLSFSAEL